MVTKDGMKAIPRELVYDMLTKENEYASGWTKGGRKTDNTASASTGQPFSLMDWVTFAEKYLNEAKLAYANYAPDLGSIRIRLLKAASLLVTALQVHGTEEDLTRLAGVSSSKFPILSGGLATFNLLTDSKGEFYPTKEISVANNLGDMKAEEGNR